MTLYDYIKDNEDILWLLHSKSLQCTGSYVI